MQSTHGCLQECAVGRGSRLHVKAPVRWQRGGAAWAVAARPCDRVCPQQMDGAPAGAHGNVKERCRRALVGARPPAGRRAGIAGGARGAPSLGFSHLMPSDHNLGRGRRASQTPGQTRRAVLAVAQGRAGRAAAPPPKEVASPSCRTRAVSLTALCPAARPPACGAARGCGRAAALTRPWTCPGGEAEGGRGGGAVSGGGRRPRGLEALAKERMGPGGWLGARPRAAAPAGGRAGAERVDGLLLRPAASVHCPRWARTRPRSCGPLVVVPTAAAAAAAAARGSTARRAGKRERESENIPPRHRAHARARARAARRPPSPSSLPAAPHRTCLGLLRQIQMVRPDA
jgi:hypothetical protein